MRPLTFVGFLESYVRSLAPAGTTLALPKLVEQTASEPRLLEPLFLWAVTSDRSARLSRLLGDDEKHLELALLVELQETGSLAAALANEDPRLRPEYSKVWRSYVVRRDATARDAELKLEARKRVLALEASKRVTRYRMAKDLGLNPGNLHAYLAQGNPTKLSLDRVLELVAYLEAA